MKKIVSIPAGQTMKDVAEVTIRPLFENTGVPGYFMIAMDIPPQMFDLALPSKDYVLLLCDEKMPRIDLQYKRLFLLSIQQVLWAVGFANIELMNAICEKPVRFLHHPFRAHLCPWKGSQAWRQIVVKRQDTGYSLQTVCVTDKSPDSYFAYLMP